MSRRVKIIIYKKKTKQTSSSPAHHPIHRDMENPPKYPQLSSRRCMCACFINEE